MTERHLISIIIPVYNVAEYLCECLDSVLAQSYRNLEIILVDDGSTDNSGDICDKYAEKDSRITVIHRENGGPSAARNAALDMMHGQYVTFIDSDDTIHPQYIKLLYDNSCRFNADISSAALTTNRGKICDNFPKGHSRLFSSTDAVKHILYQHILDNAVSGKLYNSTLWNDVRFKTAIYYEDLEVFYHIYFKTKTVVHFNSTIYYYRQRTSSRMGNFSLKRADVLDVTDNIETYIAKNHPELLPAAKDRKFSANMNILWLMTTTGIRDKKIEQRCWQNIKSLRTASLTNPNVRLKNKIGALTSFFGLSFLCLIFKLFKA